MMLLQVDLMSSDCSPSGKGDLFRQAMALPPAVADALERIAEGRIRCGITHPDAAALVREWVPRQPVADRVKTRTATRVSATANSASTIRLSAAMSVGSLIRQIACSPDESLFNP